MTELRWALLVIGLLFLVGLGWREFRRPRQARSTRPGGSGTPEAADTGRPDFTLLQQEPARERRARQEPTLDLPPVESADRVEGALSLPVVDPGDLAASEHDRDADDSFFIDEPAPRASTHAIEGHGAAAVAHAADVDVGEADADAGDAGADPELETPFAAAAAAAVDAGASSADTGLNAAGDVTPLAAHVAAPIEGPSLQETEPELEASAAPERQEKVVVVRVVPPSPERFGGRGLRQALADSGFTHGAFGIYHAHDTTGRTLASAANLMRPGTFDPAAMDDQWFHGIKLFIVLPGPLPPVRAVDELMAAARRIAGKLGGSLQDDVGRPLTLSGLAQIKADLAGITDSPS